MWSYHVSPTTLLALEQVPASAAKAPGGRHMHIRVYALRARTFHETLAISAAYQGAAMHTCLCMSAIVILRDALCASFVHKFVL